MLLALEKGTHEAWQPAGRAMLLVNDEVIEFPAVNQYIMQVERSQSILQGVPVVYSFDNAVKQMKVVSAQAISTQWVAGKSRMSGLSFNYAQKSTTCH